MDTLKNIQGVIFDYGGTIDTNSCHWAEVLWTKYMEHQVPVDKESFPILKFLPDGAFKVTFVFPSFVTVTFCASGASLYPSFAFPKFSSSGVTDNL